MKYMVSWFLILYFPWMTLGLSLENELDYKNLKTRRIVEILNTTSSLINDKKYLTGNLLSTLTSASETFSYH